MVRLAFAALVACLVCLWPSRLPAATVMIVRPASPSPELTEAVSRLHGELLAVGLAVMIADRDGAGGPSGESPRAWLESVARDRRIDAAIDVVGGARLEAVDIWVFPPAPRTVTVTRAPVPREVESAPARLAIRATDLLRSLLIENDLLAPARPPPVPAIAAAPAPATTPARPAALGLAAGAAMLASLDGVGPALLPLLRVEGALGSWLGLQAEAAGFGTRPTVDGPGASARVAQQFGLVGVCRCARGRARWQAVVGVSLGALHTAADGQANPPLQPHSVARWSFLVAASAGARLRLTERAHLTLAAQLQLADPYVDFRVVTDGAASSGRPNLVLSLALGEWL